MPSTFVASIDLDVSLHAPMPLGLASVSPLCARVARAIEGGKLNASPEGLARTLPPQQTPILGEHSSPIMRYCRQSRTAAILPQRITCPLLARKLHSTIVVPALAPVSCLHLHPRRLPRHASVLVPVDWGDYPASHTIFSSSPGPADRRLVTWPRWRAPSRATGIAGRRRKIVAGKSLIPCAREHTWV